MSVIPSFAPYRERADVRPYADGSDGGRAYAQAHAARDLAPDLGREVGAAEPSQGLAVRLGPDRGTLVLELPSWAGETVEWMGFGRRVWDDWRAMGERLEEAPQRLLREDRPETTGGAPGYASPYRDDEGAGYGYREDYRNERMEDAPAPRRRFEAEPDAAALAAQQADEAARDVLEAQAQ